MMLARGSFPEPARSRMSITVYPRYYVFLRTSTCKRLGAAKAFLTRTVILLRHLPLPGTASGRGAVRGPGHQVREGVLKVGHLGLQHTDPTL